jgi:hypothetical protein
VQEVLFQLDDITKDLDKKEREVHRNKFLREYLEDIIYLEIGNLIDEKEIEEKRLANLDTKQIYVLERLFQNSKDWKEVYLRSGNF